MKPVSVMQSGFTASEIVKQYALKLSAERNISYVDKNVSSMPYVYVIYALVLLPEAPYSH